MCAATFILAGCSKEGTTPTCDNNVSADGILNSVSTNPCQNFGQCFGTYTGQLSVAGTSVDVQMACTLTALGESKCTSQVPVDAIECCCAALTYVNQKGTEDPSDDELVEYALQNGSCVNKQTMVAVAEADLRICRYGFGEINVDSTGGAGGSTGGTTTTTP